MTNLRCLFMLLTVTTLSACGSKTASKVDLSRGAGGPVVEIYESAPVETRLGHDDIPDAHDVWTALLQDAKTSIDLAHFYISDAPGHRLEPVLAAIEGAARRGVRVRVLVDRKFYGKYPESVDRLARQGAIAVRKLDLEPRGGVLHAKYFVIDGIHVCLGSQNMDWRALEHIHEIGIRVSSPELAGAFLRLFDYDWALAGEEPPPTSKGSPPSPIRMSIGDDEVTITPAASPQDLLPQGLLWELTGLLARLDAARTAIDVELLTYGTKTPAGQPWTPLDDALRRAAGRGVRVRMLVSEWALTGDAAEALSALGKVPGIAVRALMIPPSSGGFIPFARVAHAKYLIVDGRHAWIGTSNWEGRYFTASRNVSLFIDGRAVTGVLERVFEHAWSGPGAEPFAAR